MRLALGGFCAAIDVLVSSGGVVGAGGSLGALGLRFAAFSATRPAFGQRLLVGSLRRSRCGARRAARARPPAVGGRSVDREWGGFHSGILGGRRVVQGPAGCA
eukprot:3616229-Prymnesium_polylepis.1